MTTPGPLGLVLARVSRVTAGPIGTWYEPGMTFVIKLEPTTGTPDRLASSTRDISMSHMYASLYAHHDSDG